MASARKSSKTQQASSADGVMHPETIAQVAKRMPEEERLLDLAELFKVFGDSTRVRVLSALAVSEMCVSDLAHLLHMTTSAISHQLKELRTAKLVRVRKEGKVAYYSLDDEHVNAILAIGMQHVAEK